MHNAKSMSPKSVITVSVWLQNSVNLIDLPNDWRKTGVKPNFKPRTLSEVLIIMPQGGFEPAQNLVQDLLKELGR